MIGTAELLQHLDELLQTGSFDDYCPNGLQVEGRPTVASLAVAVTASLAVIEQARDERCDALLVHHGYFWKGEDPRVVGPKRARLAALLGAGINLVRLSPATRSPSSIGQQRAAGGAVGVVGRRHWRAPGADRLDRPGRAARCPMARDRPRSRPRPQPAAGRHPRAPDPAAGLVHRRSAGLPGRGRRRCGPTRSSAARSPNGPRTRPANAA